MSNCTVPTWNARQQTQEQIVEAREEANKYLPHVHSQQHQQNQFHFVPIPRSVCQGEIAGLAWEKGQIAVHGLGGGLFMNSHTKPISSAGAGDTLESIVHQATLFHRRNPTSTSHDYDQIQEPASTSSKGVQQMELEPEPVIFTQGAAVAVMDKKRLRSECNEPLYSGKEVGVLYSTTSIKNEYAAEYNCTSTANTTSNDTSMMTWPSFEDDHSSRTPTRSVKSKCTSHDYSTSHRGASGNKEEEHEATKGSNIASSSRRSRSAAVHNQSERRRRDKINQKLRTLQRMVPNAKKTDKSSMLDEVIDHMKLLKAQTQFLNGFARPQMMMSLGMHPQIQMSLLAQTGMGLGFGMGMGMLDMSTTAFPPAVTSPLVTPAVNPFNIPPAFAMSAPGLPSEPQANNVAWSTSVTPAATTTNPVHFTDPYSAFVPQPMDMEFFNNMAAALYRQQQANQSTSQQREPQPRPKGLENE